MGRRLKRRHRDNISRGLREHHKRRSGRVRLVDPIRTGNSPPAVKVSREDRLLMTGKAEPPKD